MRRVPVFKSHLVVRVSDDQRLVVLSERDRRIVTSPLLGRVARQIDGRRTREEIGASVHPVDPSGVYEALDFLEREGCTADAIAGMDRAREAFWEYSGVPPSDAAERLRTHPVCIISYDDATAGITTAALQGIGVEVSEQGSFRVVITDDYLNPDLAELNSEALRTARPWMLVKPRGIEAWIGPIFVPGETGCWRCLADRLKENRWIESGLWGQQSYPPVSIAELPATSGAALALAATQAAKWLASGGNEALQNRLWSLDLTDLSTRSHVVIRRPQCPECTDRTRQWHSAVPPLENRSKVYSVDGGCRTCSPEATLAALERHVSPITGLVLETSEVHGPNPMLHVWTAVHTVPLPAGGNAPGAVEPARVAGKGFTASQARASCLAEAIERYSAVFRGDEPRIRARYCDLEGQAVHPATLLHFSEAQYRAREGWNRTHGPRHHVPEPFDENVEIEWTPAWSLGGKETRYVPAAYCYLRYPVGPRHTFCRADSNGCAAGNVIEEAILQGFLELVERDAVALWWYNRARRPGMDPAEFGDPLLTAAQAAFAREDRTVRLLDVTTDIRIAVFVAVSWNLERRSVRLGMGSHPEPRLAAARAVSELYQVMSGKRSERDAEAAEWDRTATVESQPYVVPLGGSQPPSSFWQAPATTDLVEDIQISVDRAAACGLEVMVVNLTRAEVGFPVVRVVVPGLRHLPARFGPGRLYDVPAKLGWVTRPLDESELNPLPFLL